MSLADALEFLQGVVALPIKGPIGECPLLFLPDEQLYRSSAMCAHFYSGLYIHSMLGEMEAGKLCCAGCTADDLHYNEGKKKGFFTFSLLKGYVKDEVITEEEASRVILKMMKTYSMDVLLELDDQFRHGYKRCPGPTCDAWVIKPYKHGCHHMRCKLCNVHFCYRCLNYSGNGSHYFTGINGCTTPGCQPFCEEDVNECCCIICELCTPGVSCEECDVPCPSCKVDGSLDEDLAEFM